MATDLVKKTAEYVKLKLYKEPGAHDWFHVERVWKIAKNIQKEEGGDLEMVELIALLHDLGDYKKYDFDEAKGFLVLKGMMDIIGIDEDKQKNILEMTDQIRYKGTETKTPKILEGKIVQDADFLDALGAVGVARTFTVGGMIGRVMYDPDRKPRRKLSKLDYQLKKREGTSHNYFYEKLFLLPDLMNTKTAKKVAQERVEYMKDFIKRFDDEWACKNINC